MLAELAGLGPAPADAGRAGGVDAAGLLGQVRDLAAFADQVNGELARLTGALDACGGVAEAGYSSVAGFLRHGCGRSPGRAGELVAAGRALRRLAATETALMGGEISFDAAHVICRVAGQIEDQAAVRAGTPCPGRSSRPSLSNLLCELGQLSSFCYITVGSFRCSGQTGTRSPNATENAFMAAFQP